MIGADLYEELWGAVGRVRQQHIDRLRRIGVDPAAVAELGARQHPFGVASVEWLKDGFYQQVERGIGAVLQPVLDPEDNTVVDLVAWSPDDPSRWFWRTGDGTALGLELLDRGDSILVVSTPMAWLSAAGMALSILDWSPASPIWSELRSAPPLTFDDDGLCQRVRNAMILAAPMPPMELNSHAR